MRKEFDPEKFLENTTTDFLGTLHELEEVASIYEISDDELLSVVNCYFKGTKQTYAKITNEDGNWVICEQGDILDHVVDSEEGDKYTIEFIEMYPSEVEALPEFDGW